VQHVAQHGADDVWVTDAGDWFQGTPEGNSDKGASIVECLNRLGLVAAQIGNHEFDFGEANVAAIVGLAKHPVLGANIVDKQDRPRPYAKPFVVREKNGVRIAIVGLITRETKSVATGPFGDAEFADEEATLARILPGVRAESDAVVLLTHCGLEVDHRLAKRFPFVLLILGGHSHTLIRREVKEGSTWIVQSGSKGGGVTRVALALDRDRREARVLSSRFEDMDADRIGVDEAARAFVAERFGKISAEWDQEIGRLEGDLGKSRGRTPNSTAAGNLVARIVREAGEADVGLTNKGGVRSGIQLGPISRRQVYELVPFENSVAVFKMSGVTLRALLQEGLDKGRQPLEIDGASYGYEVEGGTRQLTWVKVADRDVEDAKSYRVATNSFLAKGGDGFTVFRQAEPVAATPRTERYLRDLLIEKLVSEKTLKVTGEARIQGPRQ